MKMFDIERNQVSQLIILITRFISDCFYNNILVIVQYSCNNINIKLNEVRKHIMLIRQIVSICFLPSLRCECEANTRAALMLNFKMKN
jgi:hypothetical protein